MQSSLDGQAGIALGNVVGTNVFNVLFIRGISALITPLVVSRQLVRIDVPVIIGTSALLIGLAADGNVSRAEGGLLFAGLIAYTGMLIWMSRRVRDNNGNPIDARAGDPVPNLGRTRRWPINIGFIAVGLGMLVLGSRWLVSGAVEIAEAAGVSELVIGLTIIAAGTSLPEVATSVLASIRGQRDIAVGNVVGSNIMNIIGVLGLTTIVSHDGIAVPESMTTFDLPIMFIVAFACLPIFFSGHVIARWEGLVFFGYYLAYTLYLVLNATQHDALDTYTTVMQWFVVPLTVVTMIAVGAQSLRNWRSTRLASSRGR